MKRIYEIKERFGQHTVNKWADSMFNAEQLVIINREIEKRNKANKKDEQP